MSDSDIYRIWDRYWKKCVPPTAIGRFSMALSIREVEKVLRSLSLPPNSDLLEVGCGSGRTLQIIRGWGYRKAIGIDNSPQSIRLCAEQGLREGKEVFLMDATRTAFPDRAFSLVFAEGVLEHFPDFSPLVREMCRASSRYVLLVQPNHFSLLGWLSHLLQERLRDNVREYSYRWQQFRDAFREEGYYLQLRKHTLLRDCLVLLFRKTSENRFHREQANDREG
jgi:SAM-dependent methyltransferase